MSRTLHGFAFAVFGLALTLSGASATGFDSTAVSGLGARNIGSAAMSGRIAAIAARQEPDGKVTLFVGAASGGVWKSTDGGTTFKPVFDREPVQSVGAIALDPSHPKVVWVGTGESWTRNSVSIGNGIYKSTDGGETWTNMGLPESERIARIIVNPKDGNVVYACVPGKLWSDSADRGLYKTVDGGKSWSLILKGSNLSTGCSSVTLNPKNPEELMAGLWDFRRKGWTFRSGGDGPDAPSGSALYRSADGGKSWTELSAANSKGLPARPWGRIEVVYAPSNAKRVYAAIENVRTALYVSDDGGTTWQERDRSQRMVWRPFYFQRLVVDPTNADRLFKMNLALIASEDGGKSFTDASGGSHGDWHDIWINPKNPKHVIGGDDGGLWISYDGGVKWWKGGNLPISQFYHVSVDDKDPYQVYGGLQDNACWTGDSAYPGGIGNDRWENFCGGDGFFMFSDPADPRYLYAETQGGFILRADRQTYAWRDIQPKAGYKEKLRFNWNTPIAFSPNEKGTIYIGAQFLFRSRDHGVTWQRISPDLTTNDPEKQKQEESGGITVDNSAAEMHTTIYAISESPKNAGVIWVGTDDGNVQVTRDGAKTWTNVVGNAGVPKASWVNWVEASRFDEATAYVAFDRHTFGDMNAYVYRTRDYGKTWQALITPQTPGVRGYAHVVKEDPKNPNILFVGTEFGLYVSIDGGSTWAAFRPNDFPAVAVRDMAFQTRDDALVLATHGRGIWIIDDLSPIRALTPATLESEVALIPSAPQQQRIEGNGGWANGDAAYTGENPPDGVVISYYQKARHVIGRLKLEILNAKGEVIATLPASPRKGLNRVVWSMRDEAPVTPPAATIAFGSTRGPRFPPDTYTVRLTKAGKVYTMPLTVVLDRRATYSLADKVAQYQAAKRVSGLFRRMTSLVGSIMQVRDEAGGIAAKLPAGDALKAELRGIADHADALRKEVVATKEGGAITGEERLREHMDYVYGAITSVEDRPTAYQIARIDVLERELKEVEDAFGALMKNEVGSANSKLKAKGLPEIVVKDTSMPPSGGGGDAKTLASSLIGLRLYDFTGVRQGRRTERD
ncbi:MAG: sialidase [Alphaproteobacteria bacterium]|nr:sialidase [Alphaproteobacteria bacterium]MDE2630319.1 sialidase [Alphaproteobacteria bacterium]